MRTTLITLGIIGSLFSTSLSAKTTELTIAQWGQEKYLIYLPFYVAMEKGYFKKNGLDIKIKFSGNDDQTFATVIKGDAQFGIGDPVFAAIAQEKGFPARVVGTLVGGVAVWGIGKKNAKVIEKVSDLAGLKVGTFPEPSTVYTLMHRLIIDNNLTKTSIVQAPIGSQLVLLENDDAQIAMELEPSASLAESKGYKVIYSPSKFYGEFAFTGVTTTEGYLKDNPEITRAFLKSLDDAMQESHKNPAIAIEVAHKIFPNLDIAVVKNAVNRMINENIYPKHIAVGEEAWNNAISTRKFVGDIKDIAKTKATVDNSYAPKTEIKEK